MLEIALIFLCISMILHLGRSWIHITAETLEKRRYERMKSTIDWKSQQRNAELGSSVRGSALART